MLFSKGPFLYKTLQFSALYDYFLLANAKATTAMQNVAISNTE